MIEASCSSQQLRRIYDLWSHGYDFVAEPFQRAARRAALEKAAVQPHDKVLEVAVGTGAALLDIAGRLGPLGVACGVDLSAKMLATCRRRLNGGLDNQAALFEANALKLPFADNAFDVLFNAYMLNLVRLVEIPEVLREFFRVLKPSGRLVLLNYSKAKADERTWWERIYERLPRGLAGYLLGGCRPVVVEAHSLQAGFQHIDRELHPGLFLATEIVTAKKPAL